MIKLFSGLLFLMCISVSQAEEQCISCDFQNVSKKYINGEKPSQPDVTPNPPTSQPNSATPPPITRGPTPSPSFPTTAATPDYRPTGSYYYDAGSYRDLSPREQRIADSYQQSAIDLRPTPVSFNNAGFTPAQKQEIATYMDRLGVNYDKTTNTISPSPSSSARDLSIDDRVRKAVQDVVAGPLGDINRKLDMIKDQLNDIEGSLAAVQDNSTPSKSGAKPKRRMPLDKRTLASIPNTIPPAKGVLNPLDLDEIINKAYYVRDGAHWEKTQSLSAKQSLDPLTKKLLAKEIFKSLDAGDGSQVRVLEMVNKKDQVVGIKVFIYRPDKSTWVPVFYKPDPITQSFSRQNTYHDQKLPYACINCHGGSLRKMSPEVQLSNWKIEAKK